MTTPAKRVAEKTVSKADKSDRATHSTSPAKNKNLISFAASKTKNAATVVADSAPAKAVTGSFDNSLAPKQKPIKSVVSYRHTIALQFWVGLLALVTNRNSNINKVADKNTTNVIVQMAAWTVVYAILFGLTATGRTSARVASGLGWLILGTLIFQQEYVRTKAGVDSRFSIFLNNKFTENNGPIPAPNGGGGGTTKKVE